MEVVLLMEPKEDRYQADIIRSVYGDAVSSLIPVLALIYILLSVIFYGSPYLKETMDKWWTISFTSFSVNLIVVAAFITRSKNEKTNYSLWAYRYDAICFITGISHGYFCMLLQITNEVVAMSYISFIIAAAIGSSVNAGLRPIASACYLVPIFIMAGINFWHSDYFTAYVISAFISILLSASFSYKSISILKKSIDLRFENDELIEELKEQRESEKQANLDKSRFISAASHDLRQPLQSTNFMFEALKSKLNTSEQKALFSKTQNSLTSLNTMIDSLLDISRFDSGMLRVTSKVFNVREALLQEISQHKPEASKRNILIRCICDERLTIFFDPIVLRRITSNLVDNAIKHSNSEVIFIRVAVREKQLIIEVQDEGVGIPKNHQSEIFKEFYQVNNPERDRRKGTGLGLSIISRLVNHLNGKISLESEEKKGSTFKLTIPLEQKEEDEGSPSEIKQSVQSNIVNRRIVVVDDDADVLESLELLLESWGVRTIPVSNTVDAINRINQLSNPDIDAIIADYRLRDNKTGLDSISEMKSHLNLPDLPSLIITGDTEQSVLNKIKGSGTSLLCKPVNAEALHKELNLLLKESFATT
jgi:signal transduction histidine kinase/ActR/RegA family two-component response regulator